VANSSQSARASARDSQPISPRGGHGGIFKSRDGGAHWAPDGLREQKIFVNPVAVDPRNARSDGSSDWHRLGLAGEGADVLAISSDGRVS